MGTSVSGVSYQEFPLVSVILPVFNAAPYLAEAIQSILVQTYENFELVIVDDASDDESGSIIGSFSDSRIVRLSNEVNKGLSFSLNRGMRHARGAFLARMDADDISLPDRFARQVDYLQKHPDVAVCGAWMETFGTGGETVWKVPEHHDVIASRLVFESALCHPTVMLHRRLFVDAGLEYAEELQLAQDFELWSRCFRSLRFANIPEVLLRYRLHDHNLDSARQTRQTAFADKVRLRLIAELGLQASDDELLLHSELSTWRVPMEYTRLEQAHAWLLRLLQANDQRLVFPSEAFPGVLAERWSQLCFTATNLGLPVLRLYYCSPLRSRIPVPLRHHLLFLIRSVLRQCSS